MSFIRKMILRRYKDVMQKGVWRDILLEFREKTKIVMMTKEILPDDELFYITYGEDFCMNARRVPTIKSGGVSTRRVGKNIVELKDGDTVGLAIFHNLGKIWILTECLVNVLKAMGFSPTIVNDSNVFLNGIKIFSQGASICNASNTSKCFESGTLTIKWDARGYIIESTQDDFIYDKELATTDKFTVVEKAIEISGIENQASILMIPFNRGDFEIAFIAEM
ncbi:MAG: hypothetical protein ACTSQA_04775, partial [Candidatus Heimdallarchaeaceae archaeon]